MNFLTRGVPRQTFGKGRGIRCATRVYKGSLILEYVGEVIDKVDMAKRMREYVVRAMLWTRGTFRRLVPSDPEEN